VVKSNLFDFFFKRVLMVKNTIHNIFSMDLYSDDGMILGTIYYNIEHIETLVHITLLDYYLVFTHKVPILHLK